MDKSRLLLRPIDTTYSNLLPQTLNLTRPHYCYRYSNSSYDFKLCLYLKKHIAMNNGQKPFELLHVTLTFMDISKYRLIAAIVESRIYVFRFVKTFEMEGVSD